jgi:serine/threonine protein kinase/WD40 repeat protein/tetratricopeptide (TPR) repeat protein
MTGQADEVEAVFLAALDKTSPQERAAYVEGACAGKPELLGRVRELLASHEGSRGPLDGPPPGLEGTVDQPRVAGRPGTAIGPYKLLQPIGEGGMGTVFMAEQQQPVWRKVALKLIKAGMDSKQVIARFEAERQALALMDHPNIARVLDAGTTEGGRPYFVMELVKGVPLTNYCDEHRLTPRERLGLFVPVCQAVQHAHQKGIIHRDLKPSNVLVALYDGRPVPKVIDFGIAKATGPKLTERTLFTEFGAVVGTLEYMSPEQAELNQLDIDTRSDIYSLGVLLYELLTGTTPLEGKRLKKSSLLESLRLIREEEPPRPSTRLSTTEELPSIAANRGLEPKKLSGLVRGELDWIVMKCLEKDRNRRYETANGLARDIERHLNDEPVLACPPSAWYRFRKLVRRNTAAVLVAATISVLLVVGAVVSTTLAVWAIRAEGRAEERLGSEKAERERAVEAERERKRELVWAKLAQVRAGRWSRQVGQRFDGLKALTEAAALARELEMDKSVFGELRDEMVACLALADVRRLKRPWPGFPVGSATDMGFDADLEVYARSDGGGTIEVRRVEGERLVACFPGVPSVTVSFRFSPDGSLLVVRYSRQIPGQPTNTQVWDWRRKELVFRTPFPVVSCDYRPDGRWLALAQGNGTVIVYEVGDWKQVSRLKAESVPASLAFHPDGTRLAFADPGGTVGVWEVATGKILWRVSTPRPNSLAWHPDGDLLAAGCYDRNVRLWDGATGRPHAVLSGHQRSAVAVAFAAGGDLLVTAGWDSATRLWDPWTGRELLRFTGDARYVSRDGRRLAGRAGSNLAVWEVAPGREYLPLPTRPGEGWPGGWDALGGISPDGRWLVASGDRCRIWDLALRKEVASLSPTSGVRGVKFHPTRQEFFTSSPDGLYRWSFKVSDGALRIRPTSRLLPPGSSGQISLDRQGGLLAVVREGEAVAILDLKDPPGRVRPLEHGDVVTVSLSPDGRWAVSGAHNRGGIGVWDAQTGKLVAGLNPDQPAWHWSSRPIFSPDGRWLLAATGSGFRIWEPGTWRPVRQIPREQTGDLAAGAAFAPDGKVLAVAVSLTTVLLVDTETGQPLARLEGPDADLIDLVGFTPDGGRLLVSRLEGIIRVWDLRRIREQLAGAGLDWDRPAYPPAPPPGDVKPVRGEVDEALFRQVQLDDAAIVALRKAVERQPDDAGLHAWLGAAFTAKAKWDEAAAEYGKAIELGKAIGLGPKADWFWSRAWAYLQSDQPDRAIADCSKGIELRRDYAWFWAGRGGARAALGRWGPARADLARATELAPQELFWCYRALAELGAGNAAEYRKLCATALERFGNTADPGTAWVLAWACVLAPDAVADPARPLQLAEFAAHPDPPRDVHGRKVSRGLVLGAALLRAGKPEAAVQRLTKEVARHTDGPVAWLLLALAHHRLGHADEARKWLARAVQWTEKAPRTEAAASRASGLLPRDQVPWEDRLWIGLLRREAEALIKGPAPDPKRPMK